MKKTEKSDPIRHFYLYLVSDATGVTLQGLVRASLAQFEAIDPVERFWPLVRSEKQLARVIDDIHDNPGPVLFTLMDKDQRKRLEKACKELQVPCIPVMDHIIKGLSAYTGLPSKGIPGLQHALDDKYFKRMDAVDFALSFDDGQNYDGIDEADVILVGVSRTSKTPTCIFLARQGVKAANIPYVPGIPIPDKVLQLRGPVFIGLTENPDRLIHLRKNRLKADTNDYHHDNNSYLDPERVEAETLEARRFFTRQGWPVIDVTRRSVEETSAEILMILQRRRETAGVEKGPAR